LKKADEIDCLPVTQLKTARQALSCCLQSLTAKGLIKLC